MADPSSPSNKIEVNASASAKADPLKIRVHNKGADVAHVGTAVTTPKADKSVKVVKCPTYKTLCSALFQLAKREDELGTAEFCHRIINPTAAWTGGVINDHTTVVGGGDPNAHVEDTEFRMVGTNHFFDTEYIEAGYALSRMGLGPDLVWLLYLSIKRTVESGVPEYILDNIRTMAAAMTLPITIGHTILEGKPTRDLESALEQLRRKGTGQDAADLMKSLKALFARKSFENPPNANGMWLGEMIANNYGSIGEFARKYCRSIPADLPDECSDDPEAQARAARQKADLEQLKHLPKLEPRPPFVPPPKK